MEHINEKDGMSLEGEETMDVDGFPIVDDYELGQEPAQRSVRKSNAICVKENVFWH